jgi:uncharacterized surface protein with fasciclin (FAS1) repeats
MRLLSLTILRFAVLLALAGCEPPKPQPRDVEKEAAEATAAESSARNGIMAAVRGRADLSGLAGMLDASGLVPMIAKAEQVTLFAPTNAAIAKLPAETREFMMADGHRAALQQVVGMHMTPGLVNSQQMVALITTGAAGGADVRTSNSYALTATQGEDGRLRLADANGNIAIVSESDIAVENGVIHVIDAVMLPPQ